MNANILELMDIQREVNLKVREKAADPISEDQFLLAFNVELFEYFNAVGTWKWWKHSHTINREKILDELADCFAFFLSIIDVENEAAVERDEPNFVEQVEYEINDILDILVQNLKNTSQDPFEIITDLILYVGTDNETKGILTVERFAIAIFIAMLLFDGITWGEITAAYREKSAVNIERQVNGY